MSTMELGSLKLVVLGDIEAGKTCLLAQYTGNPITQASATVGIDLFCKNIAIGDIAFKAKIWDTAGTERYRSINRGFYKGALGALLVFDVSKEISKSQLDEWEKELKNIITKPSVVFVGNKVDIGVNEDSQKMLQQYCKEHKYLYIETSAKDGTNVKEAFSMLIDCIEKSKGLRKVLKESAESFVLSISPSDYSCTTSTYVNKRPCQC